MKIPFVIYANTQCLLEKIHACDNDPTKSLASNINKHTYCDYSLSTHCSFDKNKSNHDFYWGNESMKNFCADLMLPLTEEQEEQCKKQEFCHICKQRLYDINADENSHRVWDHCHYTSKFTGTRQSICNLKNKTAKEIHMVFHNDSIYD